MHLVSSTQDSPTVGVGTGAVVIGDKITEKNGPLQSFSFPESDFPLGVTHRLTDDCETSWTGDIVVDFWRVQSTVVSSQSRDCQLSTRGVQATADF